MAVLLEAQLTTRPVSTLLLASRVTAESCSVPPTWRVAVAGDTDTDATGTGTAALTVIATGKVLPSLEAVTVAEPAATAVTSPDAETVLIAGLLELQLTTRPVSTLLLASRVVAESCTVAPMPILAAEGDTVIDATGVGGGGAEADVLAETMFESDPNTALKLSVPRNATSWKSYCVEGFNPRTLQTSWMPMPVPRMGTAHVPLVVEVAAPHEIGVGA
jgi:hypothetical protein